MRNGNLCINVPLLCALSIQYIAKFRQNQLASRLLCFLFIKCRIRVVFLKYYHTYAEFDI